MDANSALAQTITQITSRKILVNIHYVLCVIALWFIIPIYYYMKIWYIVTAFATAATIVFALIGAIRVDGLYKAIIPIIAYFLYLLLTSTWAADPSVTILQVLVDSILLINFGLFFLVGINNSIDRIANTYILAAYPAVVTALLYAMYDPGNFLFVERVGWMALFLLPYALPFCIWRIKTIGSRSALVSLLLTLLLILISKTRAPILIAAVLIPMTTIVLSKNLRSGLVFSLKIGIMVLVFIAGAAVFETPRSFMAEGLERLQGRTTEWAGLGEQSEDWLRALTYSEGLKLLVRYQPLGMGYMNFEPWFEKTFGIDSSQHSAMLAWGLEGGLICVIIVLYLLYRFYAILLKMVKDSEGEYEKGFYKALMVAMVGVLMNAVVNQAHQGPTLFVLLGIAYSLPYRSKLYSASH